MEKLENSVPIIERFDCPGGKLKRIYLENFDGNLSVEEFLPLGMGPSSVPTDVLVPITIFYVLLIVFGLEGNAMTYVTSLSKIAKRRFVARQSDRCN